GTIVTALLARPVNVAVIGGAAGTVLESLALFGVHMTSGQIAAVVAAVNLVLGYLVMRPALTPVTRPRPGHHRCPPTTGSSRSSTQSRPSSPTAGASRPRKAATSQPSRTSTTGGLKARPSCSSPPIPLLLTRLHRRVRARLLSGKEPPPCSSPIFSRSPCPSPRRTAKASRSPTLSCGLSMTLA